MRPNQPRETVWRYYRSVAHVVLLGLLLVGLLSVVGCEVETSIGRYDCQWTPSAGVVCHPLDVLVREEPKS